MIAPTFVPALKIPTARARSLRGNHSATAFKLAGKTPASPNPSTARATMNAVSDDTNPCAIAAKLQVIIAIAYPMRVPTLSTSRPSSNIPKAYAVVKATTRLP